MTHDFPGWRATLVFIVSFLNMTSGLTRTERPVILLVHGLAPLELGGIRTSDMIASGVYCGDFGYCLQAGVFNLAPGPSPDGMCVCWGMGVME